MSKKEKTYDQAAAMQQKAVRFLRDVVGDEEKANEIESLSVSDYADRKRLVLTNPAASSIHKSQRSKHIMSYATLTKPELQSRLEAAESTMDAVWNFLVDLDEDSSQDDLADGALSACEALNEYDSERFPFEDDDEESIEPESEE